MHNGDRKPVVVKIGSECLFDIVGDSFNVHEDFVKQKGEELKFMYDNGVYPLLVTSGAIPLGMHDLGLNPSERNNREKYDKVDLQAFATHGQPILQGLWEQYADMKCGQYLIHKSALENHPNTLESLMRMSKYGLLPVINENDALYSEEVYGDNDRTSQLIAKIVGAQMLVFQCAKPYGFEGVDGKVIPHISEIRDEHYQLCSEASTTGSGTGMAGKLRVIEDTIRDGTSVVLSNKSVNIYDAIQRMYEGERTVFGNMERLL